MCGQTMVPPSPYADLVETDRWDHRTRLCVIYAIIKTHERQDGVAGDRVVNLAQQVFDGMNEEEVREHLDELIRVAAVYSPRNDRWFAT